MFAELVLGVALIAICLGLYTYHSQAKVRKMLAKIPGPPGLPLLGNAHQLERKSTALVRQLREMCMEYYDKPIFKLMLGTQPIVFCIHPESCEFLLNSPKYLSKSRDYRFLHPWLGFGLLTSTGEKWRRRRKMLTPTFHFRILADFLNVFNDQAATMVERLNTQCGQGAFNIFPYITMCALDIICETAMGKKINAQTDGRESTYVNAITETTELVQQRQKQPWLWPNFIYSLVPSGRTFKRYVDIMHRFTKKVIEDRVKEVQENPEEFERRLKKEDDENAALGAKRRLAFLDLLLNMAHEAGFTHDDIQEEVDTFMFEGHDTTAAAANWAVHLIGAHPEVQARLHDEMDAIFGDSDRPVASEDLPAMKYLDCVIKETLRLFPSVPMFGRDMHEDVNICGYEVPAGSTVAVLTGGVHEHPKVYPDPDRFDPDRFSKEESAGRHPYAFIPFSAGPRNCIGQRFAMNEEKVILSAILRNFVIESMQTREELDPVGAIILKPENGIIVKLTRRIK